MPTTELIFQVADVIFQDFEVPEELGDVGGTQLLAEHRYPGGAITQQPFGAFPSEIQWMGWITGPTALSRMRQMDRIRVAAAEVPLVYGDLVFLGILTQFTPTIHSQWRIRYRARFRPRVDQSSIVPNDQPLDAFNGVADALDHLQTMIGVVGGFVSSAVSGGISGSAIDSTVLAFYMPLPPVLAPLLATFILDTQQALLTAQGVLANIPFNSAAQIYADAEAFLAAATPLTQSGDPTISSPSVDAIGYVNTVTTTVANPSLKNQTVVQAVNPNLPMLAAEYYNDPTKWRTIANANNIKPPDPLPVGSFALIIPPVAVN